jgi:hypothetical protein
MPPRTKKIDVDTRCLISELPAYSCHDCKHDLHGKGVRLDSATLEAVIGPATYGERDDPVRFADIDTQAGKRLMEASHDGSCSWPDCTTGRIKPGEQLLRHEDHGWVHARHML